MSRTCPIKGRAIYQDCKECRHKEPCNAGKLHKELVIGIDQSYKRCGISIAADGKLLKVGSVDLQGCQNHSEARKKLRHTINRILQANENKGLYVVCIIERIRQFSKGFISMGYITGMGALNSVIVDACYEHGIEVFSVDTKSWKARVVGTSKPEDNPYGVPPEKYPTVKWCIGMGFEKSIMIPVKGRKEKGTFLRGGCKYEYDNDAADSAGIAMSWFSSAQDGLTLEQ